MKLKSFLLIGAIVFGFGQVFAQTDGDAKNLYYAYRQRTTVTTTTVVSTTTVTTGGLSTGGATGGATAASTGLPGTKVTIELLRGEKLRFVKPSFKFKSGDRIRLRLRTNFEGYVSVLNLGSSGRVNLLFPVRGMDNRVRPTTDYQIPKGDGWIVFDDRPGTETLSVIMSEEPLEGLGGLDANADYFRRDRVGKNLYTEYDGNDYYAVFGPREPRENVGFTLRLKHK